MLPQGVHQALEINLPILFANLKRSLTNFVVQIVQGLIVGQSVEHVAVAAPQEGDPRSDHLLAQTVFVVVQRRETKQDAVEWKHDLCLHGLVTLWKYEFRLKLSHFEKTQIVTEIRSVCASFRAK